MADVKRVTPREYKHIGKELDQLQMQELFRYHNIFEVLSKSKVFKIGDFHDFFSGQWKLYKGEVIKDWDVEIKAMEAQQPAPEINLFSVQSEDAALSHEEGEFFCTSMTDWLGGGGSKAKAAKVKKAATGEGPEEAGGPEELDEIARGTIADWEQFQDEAWGLIFDAQMMRDYQSRMNEIKQEVERIIMLAKQGAIDPEFVLIALAKVNATKNGVLMTWLGKKAFHVNESLSNIANELHTMNPADPQSYAMTQLSREKTRDGTFQLNLLVSDMQKVMQDVASVMEQVHGMIGEINRTRREIIMKLNPPPG